MKALEGAISKKMEIDDALRDPREQNRPAGRGKMA